MPVEKVEIADANLFALTKAGTLLIIWPRVMFLTGISLTYDRSLRTLDDRCHRRVNKEKSRSSHHTSPPLIQPFPITWGRNT